MITPVMRHRYFNTSALNRNTYDFRKNPSAPQKVPAEQPKERRSEGGGRSSDFVIFVLELLLPVALTSALIYWASGILGIWNLNRTLALVIIAIALVVFSLFISISLDGITLPMRQKSDAGRIFNRANARARLVKFILGGLVIPIAVFAAANLVSLPTHETVISVLMRPRSLPPKAPLVVAIGNTIINSANSATKVQGIKPCRPSLLLIHWRSYSEFSKMTPTP